MMCLMSMKYFNLLNILTGISSYCKYWANKASKQLYKHNNIDKGC